MNSYFLQIGIFLAAIVAVIFDFQKIVEEIKKPKKNIEFGGLYHRFGLLTFLGAWGQVFQTVDLSEDFSSGMNNLQLVGKSENICFYPSHKVFEPIALKIKDSWTNLQYQTDYEVRSDNSVFIKFIYLENKDQNRQLAARGLVFTYKTKLFLFSPELIKRHLR